VRTTEAERSNLRRAPNTSAKAGIHRSDFLCRRVDLGRVLCGGGRVGSSLLRGTMVRSIRQADFPEIGPVLSEFLLDPGSKDRGEVFIGLPRDPLGNFADAAVEVKRLVLQKQMEPPIPSIMVAAEPRSQDPRRQLLRRSRFSPAHPHDLGPIRRCLKSHTTFRPGS
jgi:hypothetical protein